MYQRVPPPSPSSSSPGKERVEGERGLMLHDVVVVLSHHTSHKRRQTLAKKCTMVIGKAGTEIRTGNCGYLGIKGGELLLLLVQGTLGRWIREKGGQGLTDQLWPPFGPSFGLCVCVTDPSRACNRLFPGIRLANLCRKNSSVHAQ